MADAVTIRSTVWVREKHCLHFCTFVGFIGSLGKETSGLKCFLEKGLWWPVCNKAGEMVHWLVAGEVLLALKMWGKVTESSCLD